MFIAIIFITLIFGFIIFNVINNKKISFMSTILLVICITYLVIYNFYDDHYNKLKTLFTNIELYFKIFCIVCTLIAFIEFYLGYKYNLKKANSNDNEIINNSIEVNKQNDSIDNLIIYIELFDEPLAILLEEKYIINTKMKKHIKNDDTYIDKNEFLSLLDYKEKMNFYEKDKTIVFRFKNNNEKLFEAVNIKINNNDYQLIRQTSNIKVNHKINLRTYKDLNSDTKAYLKEDKNIYLIFINIINIQNIISFYGKDYCDLVINKYLIDVYNLPFIFQLKIYYISKTEYVILLEDKIEYNALLSELEDNISIILNDEIVINNNIIDIKTKVGTIASNDVNDYHTLINKGYEMMKLACSEDYPGDFAIFHEGEETIDFDFGNIDIDFDLSGFKKRLQ